jgi:hypothetical protein
MMQISLLHSVAWASASGSCNAGVCETAALPSASMLQAGALPSRRSMLQDAVKNTQDESMKTLQDTYLETVRMGLLGGLNHAAYTDINRGATTDPGIRNECLIRDWMSGATIDNCVMKWDANERLMVVDKLYRQVREQNIPGDLMECGVWRGGITVYMRALMKAFGDDSRNVWVSDSFNGVPNAARQESNNYEVPDDIAKMDKSQWGGSVTEPDLDGKVDQKNILTVEQTMVTDNFVRFGLFDDKVKMLPGWFNESLPEAPQKGLKQLAILRVDGDLYTSTMDVLQNMYQFVSPGGFVIFDDYPLPQSRRAIEDFFKANDLSWDLINETRMTEEKTPVKDSNINHYAFFQKPF